MVWEFFIGILILTGGMVFTVAPMDLAKLDMASIFG